MMKPVEFNDRPFSMIVNTSATRFVAKPPHEVWAFFSNIENWSKFVSGAVKNCWTCDDAPRVGATFTMEFDYFGTNYVHQNIVTRCEPNRLFAVKPVHGIFPLLETFIRVEEAPGGSRVTYMVDAGPAVAFISWAAFLLLAPVMRQLMNMVISRELERACAILVGEGDPEIKHQGALDELKDRFFGTRATIARGRH